MPSDSLEDYTDIANALTNALRCDEAPTGAVKRLLSAISDADLQDHLKLDQHTTEAPATPHLRLVGDESVQDLKAAGTSETETDA